MSFLFPNDCYLSFPVVSLENKIRYTDQLLFIGSCFSDLIPHRLRSLGFVAFSNPQGILFNPTSILHAISYQKDKPNEDHLVENKYGEWRSLDFHSSIFASSKDDLIEMLKTKKDLTIEYLQKSKYVFISLGTAWVFRYKKTDKIIANCQKLAAENFTKELLTESEIVRTLSQIGQVIHSVNSQIHIIWTVSPIRHIKNGLFENNVSKSRLLSSIYSQIEETKSNIYLPIYEIVIDCLRDYRFYGSDLIHPSEEAENIILDYFIQNYFTQKSLDYYGDHLKLRKLEDHQVNSSRTQAIKQHQDEIERMKTEMKRKYHN